MNKLFKNLIPAIAITTSVYAPVYAPTSVRATEVPVKYV